MCIFKNCITEINNRQVDNAQDTDVVMLMYILIECSNNFKKTGSLLQYYRDEATLDNINDSAIFYFPDNNTTDSFKFKEKATGQTCKNGAKNVEIMAPLKYVSNLK